MKILALFFLTASLALASVTTTITVNGRTLPASIQDIPWISATNYGARDNPGQGMGVSYRGESMKIDIYVYDSLNADWAGLPLKERIKRENESILDIFKTLTERGDYSNVKARPRETVKVGNWSFDHTELDFTDKKAGDLNSHYYLAELQGKILKIRISRLADSDPSQAKAAFEEIAAALAAK